MTPDIKISLDLSRYRAPTEKDIKAAKQFILQREEFAEALAGKADGILLYAAERITAICYRYNADPKRLLFSNDFNAAMMSEIEDIMDEVEDALYDLIFNYAEKAVKDKKHLNPLLLWLALLGKGNQTLRDTLHGYLYKTMKDWEAAVAALRFMGRSQEQATARVRTFLHNIYAIPEVLTAFRRRTEFAATYIRYGGVQKGAVGISNNGSTNVVNLAKRAMQMAWMRAQAMDFIERGAIGYYQLRGSSYPCDVCDDETGFHTDIEGIYGKPMPHPNCCCYRVPVFIIQS